MSEKEIGQIQEFIDSHKALHNKLEAKLDDLVNFKWKMLGATGMVAFMVSIVVRFV